MDGDTTAALLPAATEGLALLAKFFRALGDPTGCACWSTCSPTSTR